MRPAQDVLPAEILMLSVSLVTQVKVLKLMELVLPVLLDNFLTEQFLVQIAILIVKLATLTMETVSLVKQDLDLAQATVLPALMAPLIKEIILKFARPVLIAQFVMQQMVNVLNVMLASSSQIILA